MTKHILSTYDEGAKGDIGRVNREEIPSYLCSDTLFCVCEAHKLSDCTLLRQRMGGRHSDVNIGTHKEPDTEPNGDIKFKNI